MAFTLFGKVQMDATGFHRALSGMRASAMPAGRQIGNQLSKNVMAAFGGFAVVNTIQGTLKKAFDIRKGAAGANVDAETFQALQVVADQTGLSVEAIAEKMADGSEEGMKLAKAVKEATTELKEMGRVINAEDVEKLAKLEDKLKSEKSRIGVALTKAGIGAWNFLERGVQAAVAGGQILAGQLTGDKAAVQAGREMAFEAFNGPQADDAGKGATDAPAVAAAAELAKAIVKEEDKAKKQQRAERAPGAFAASSATAMGAYFTRGGPFGMNPVETKLDILNREVRAINGKISTFR